MAVTMTVEVEEVVVYVVAMVETGVTVAVTVWLG